ncbi:sterol desaturase family protein [Permianibacter sp. IMCC34836]|uniref:sterol desaturase family protein n=1 Tax=Permianibacter fluminis TaxID=2738515 RepID=UPI0015519551|nr:sterol desaturase family protein [Permianibacter fluminis]NQD37161.1 sterol desaturase family protein [Permianibacter fluminis]
MNPIVYAIPVFMLSILVEAWFAYRKRLPSYDVADAITSLHFGVLSQVAGAFTKTLTLGLYVLVYERYRALELPTDSLWVWLLAVVLYDFLYYWVHRFGHEVNLMWAAHQVHHSSEYFNLTTALRQTSTGALFGWPFYLVMAVIGVPPLVFAVAGLIDLLYQYWVHTELIGKLGWIDRVLVTPSNHRVHHGQNDYCIDKNYGGIFIIWDRLFGSFVDERDDEKVVYGVRKPLASYNPLWGNLNVYRDIWQSMRAAVGWRGKLAAVFAPPGGWNEPVPHLDTRDCRRFARPSSAGLRGYAILQYGVMVIYATHFIAVAPELNLAMRAFYAGLILLAAVSLGGVLEGSALARRVEPVRLVLFAALFLLMPDWFGWLAPVVAKVAVLALALISLLWLLRTLQQQSRASANANPAEISGS